MEKLPPKHEVNLKLLKLEAARFWLKNKADSNSFSLTPKRWIEATNAIGIISKTGKFGGTFAHRDIAFEFATWISAEFKGLDGYVTG